MLCDAICLLYSINANGMQAENKCLNMSTYYECWCCHSLTYVHMNRRRCIQNRQHERFESTLLSMWCVCVSVFHNFYPFLEILSEAVAFECALISSSETNNFPWKSGGTSFSKDIFHTQFHMNKWYQNPIGLIGCRIGTLGCKVHCFGIEFPSHCIHWLLVISSMQMNWAIEWVWLGFLTLRQLKMRMRWLPLFLFEVTL